MSQYASSNDIEFEFKCKCGEVLLGLLGEEYDNRETLHCKCGKKYLIIDVTND